MGIGRELRRLSALVVRVEAEIAFVHAADEDHARRRASVGGRGRERRGLGLEELRGPGLREPPREDRVRIAAEPVQPFVHRAEYCRDARIRSEAMAATRTIDIRTAIPGPRSRALAEREARVIARPLLVHLPIFAERAENATITDVDGNVFVDFAGGVGVVNAGHGHPRIVEAVVEQAARFLHTDFTVVPYEPAVELAERLCALAPISGEKRAAFFNAGTEAVENAVKLARLHTGRAGRDRVRGCVPRPHAAVDDDDVEVPPLQGGDGAVRPRGLPRPVPGRVPRAGRQARRSRSSSGCSRPTSRRSTWRPS